jgi:hypothetical protein
MFNLGIVDEEEEIMKFQVGDTIVDQGIGYVVEKIEGGVVLFGYSNNAEVEIELDDDFVPDAVFYKERYM